jgi:hypothetical protein
VATGGVAFAHAFEREGEVIMSVSHSFNDREVRIVAVDVNGVEHQSGTHTGTSKGVSQTTTRFRHLRLMDVHQFEFRTRPYSWVTLEGVALHPDSDSTAPKHPVQVIDTDPMPVLPSSKSQVKLANGIVFKVAGILRGPRHNTQWHDPNGNPLTKAPVKFEQPLDSMMSGIKLSQMDPNQELLIFIESDLSEAILEGQWRYSTTFMPESRETKRSSVKVTTRGGEPRLAEWICFGQIPESLDIHIKTATGPWETVVEYDQTSKTVKEIIHGSMVLWGEPKPLGKNLRMDVMHNLDRQEYSLRMRCYLKNGAIREMIFHSGLLRTVPTKGYVLLYGDTPIDQIEKFELQRTPWQRGVIANVVVPD